MLAGVNDSLSEAEELVAWLEGLDVHVNLIPYNPIEGAPELVGTSRVGIEQFARLLKQTRLCVTIRYSLGADIGAACGQLVRRQIRRRKTANELPLTSADPEPRAL